MADTSTLQIEVITTGLSGNGGAPALLNRLGEAAASAEPKVKALTDTIEKLMNSQRTGTAIAEAYAKSMQAAVSGIAGGTASADTLASATTKLSQAMLILSEAFTKVNTSSKQSSQAIVANTAAMQDAHAMARGLSGSLGALWVTYGNMVPLAAGLAIGSAFKGIITTGMDVEHALEGIRVRGQESTSAITEMRGVIMDLGKGVYGPKEVAGALDTLILAGLNAKQAMVAVKDALNLATVGGTTIEKAAEVLVQVGTSLGYAAEGYGRIADVISATAAASMSSVESVSESFKSGSAVGKAYGLTLTDIGASFAMLSNLGIKGTAAGTAVKNFFSYLTKDSPKVKDALAQIGLSISDLQDKAGNMKSIGEVFGTLSTHLNTLTESSQKLAMANMTNQQGFRFMVEGISMVRKAGEDGGNALDELVAKIDKSYGYAAIGAAAMALTVKSQFESVKNTLQTQFVAAFQDIQPQLSLIATQLKAAFNSPEFSHGIQEIAKDLTGLGLALANNIELVKNILEAFLAWKAIAFIAGVISGIATAIKELTVALEAGKIAAIAFQGALGPLTIALGIAAAAWVWYKSKKDEANAVPAGINYMNNFTDELNKEAERLEKQTALMKTGVDAAKAAKQTMAEQQMGEIVNKGNAEVVSKVRELTTAKEQLSAADLRAYDRAVALNATEINGYANVNNVLKIRKETQAVMDQVATAQDKVTLAVARNTQASKENAEVADAQAKKSRSNPDAGSGVFVPKSKATKESGLSAIESEIIALNVQAAMYKSKQASVQAVADTEVKAIGDVNRARVEEEILQGKFAKNGQERFVEQLRQAALRADQAKFELDKAQAMADFQSNMAVGYRKTQSALTEAQTGHANLTGAYTKEAEEFLKLWGIDKNGEYGKKLLEQAAARGVLNEQLERTMRINKLAESMKTQASSAMEKGDALVEDGKGGKQTNMQLAELQIIKEKLNQTTAAGAIAELRSAAASKDLGDSYERLAGIYNTLAKAKNKAIAADSAGVIGLEGAKVAAAYATMNKNIEFNHRTEEDAINSARDSATGATAEQESYYAKVNALYLQTKALLAQGLPVDLRIAGLEDLATVFDKMSSSASKLGGYLGGLSKPLSDMGKALTNLAKADKERAAGVKGSMADQIGAYGDMAGAAAGFFKTGTTGYNTLMGVAKVAHTAQMAMQAASMAQGAINAIITAAAQTGWPGMILMAGAMAALGYAVSGGFDSSSGSAASSADRQASQGTGTVFGDASAKSDSVSKSLEYLGKNSDISLEYSSKMLGAMNLVAAGISGLTNILLRTAGITTGNNFGIDTGVIGKSLGGIWGKTTQSITDTGINVNGSLNDLKAGQGVNQYVDTQTDKSSWFGLSHSISNNEQSAAVSADIAKQFSMIFTHINDTIVTAGKMFGKSGDEVQSALNTLSINLGHVSLKDLKGADLQAALDAVISSASDQLASSVISGLEPFQKVGEGYLETLVRVSSGIEQSGAILDRFGMTAIQFSQIINKQGDVAAEIVRQTITDNERYTVVLRNWDGWLRTAKGNMNGIGEIINDFQGTATEMATLYQKLIDMRSQMKSMGLGDNLNRDLIAGAGSETNLSSGLSDYLKGMFSATEQQAIKVQSLTDKFAALGMALPTSAAAFRSLVESLTGSGQNNLAGKVLVLSGAFTDMTTSADSLASATTAAADAAAAAAKQALAQALTDAHTALTASYTAEQTALTATKTKFEAFAASLKTFRDGLLTGNLSPLTNAGKYSAAQAAYESTAAAAKTGDQTAISNYQTVASAFLTASQAYNASGAQYTEDFNRVATESAMMADWASKQVDVATASLDALNKQVEGLGAIKAAVQSVDVSIMQLYGAMVNSKDTTNYNAMASSMMQRYAGQSDPASISMYSGMMAQGASYQDVQNAITKAYPIDGSHANGLGFVPFDGYRAELHKGEAVLTASENKQYQMGVGGSKGNNSDVVAELKAMRDEVRQLKEEQRQQTASLIGANYDAQQRNADAVVVGMDDVIGSAARATAIKPSLN
jgi:TP901 family phage tail tape measure protein